MDVKIYFLREKEIHMVGDAVAVCWNIRHENRTIKGADGLDYHAKAPIRKDEPYIDFVTIRVNENDSTDVWEDEDSPVEGGMDADYAEEIAEELRLAIAYLRALPATREG